LILIFSSKKAKKAFKGASQLNAKPFILLPYISHRLALRGIYETAAKGATSAPARIAGSGKALLCYATNTPSIDEPSAGYFFAWKGLFGASAFGGRIKKFRVEVKAADRVDAEMAFDAKQIAPDLGLFASAVV